MKLVHAIGLHRFLGVSVGVLGFKVYIWGFLVAGTSLPELPKGGFLGRSPARRDSSFAPFGEPGR